MHIAANIFADFECFFVVFFTFGFRQHDATMNSNVFPLPLCIVLIMLLGFILFDLFECYFQISTPMSEYLELKDARSDRMHFFFVVSSL